MSGAKVVRDGRNHDDNPSRCVTAKGVVVGFYTFLLGYDSSGDRFRIVNGQFVPASSVDEVRLWDQ